MRIALGIEYDGHDLYGWQAQSGLPTVQQHLEDALTKIANHPVKLFCAGRTDAGVHATGQVSHFETTNVRHLHAYTLGANTHLPPGIAVRWAQQVDEQFHARFSARARTYHYIIYNHPIRSAIMCKRATWCQHELDITPMQEAANALLGEQDFSSFRSAQCESHSPTRNVHLVTVSRQQRYVIITLTANAFLHHMVRNIAGVLIRIGSGRLRAAQMQEILAAKDRSVAFETASAAGLYLAKVTYPEPYIFPKTENLPLFLL
ncbi:MAG: tRNA pseudouridine(38-40) synthase TruA [Pseudomonadota bacterium]